MSSEEKLDEILALLRQIAKMVEKIEPPAGSFTTKYERKV